MVPGALVIPQEQLQHRFLVSLPLWLRTARETKILKPESPVRGKMVKKGKQSRLSSSQSNPKARNTTKAKGKGKKKVTKSNESNKPKKPPTAFFYFLEDFRKGYQEEHPEVKSMRDIGKACGEKWKTMTFEEKVQYYDIATEKRADFEKAMTEYVKRQESGEDMEKESDESDIYE